MQGARLSSASIIVAFAAIGFWGLAGASAWAGFDPHGLAIEVGGGTSASVIAVMCALTCRLERENREKALLIKTLAGCCPAPRQAQARAQTLPQPTLRAL
jgi:hypothetical protein